jgi:hypothetical protein
MKSHQIKKFLYQKSKKISSVILLSFVIGTLTTPAAALGQSQETQQVQTQEAKKGGFIIRPTNPTKLDYDNVILELKPGQTTTETLTIQSFEPGNSDFNFYPIDFITDENGVKTYRQKNEPKETVAAWSTLNTESLTLKEDEKRNLNLTITVPPNTSFGQYQGGIAIETLQPSAKYPGIKIARRFIMAVKIKVTDNPQVLARFIEANIFNSTTPYFWISIGIFTASMAYFIYAQKREKNAKLQESKKQ